jgi:uncharacterized spore protein YtfJ
MVQMADASARTADVLSKVFDLSTVVDSAAVGNVFGQPITQDGVTVIPVARVVRGIGGGSGTAAETSADGEGGGGGLAVAARPVGVFVIKQGDVSWRPAVDVNRVILGGQIVAVFALLAIRGVVKARLRRRS